MAEGAEQQYKPDDSLFMRLTVRTLQMKFPSVKNIGTDALHSWIRDNASNEKVTVLDCRPEEEYVVSHVAESVRVDPKASDADVKETVQRLKQEYTDEKPQVVVCYCSGGYRASKYANALETELTNVNQDDQLPPTRVYNLEGSLFKWANEGRPLVDVNGKPTVYAHPFSPIWGKLLRADLRRFQP